jgi:hypothetical protein
VVEQSNRRVRKDPHQGLLDLDPPGSEAAARGQAPRNSRRLADIEAEIRMLEKKVAPSLKRLAKLRRVRAAVLAGRVSGPARIRGDPSAISDRWLELGGGRTAAKIVAGEFNCSTRTVYRKLAATIVRPHCPV